MQVPKTLLTFLLAVVFLVSIPIASAISDTYGTVYFHPFTMDPNNTTCVPTTDHGGTRNCDPVNLIFPGKTWQQVRNALLARGWTTFGLGSTQWLHVGSTGNETLIRQHAQLFRPQGWERRYHIWLWEAPGPLTIGAVHHERRVGFKHVIDMDWETAEAFVAGQFCPPASCTTTTTLTQQSNIQSATTDDDNNPNTWRTWANNMQATIISGW